jgi:hypothetical protein
MHYDSYVMDYGLDKTIKNYFVRRNFRGVFCPPQPDGWGGQKPLVPPRSAAPAQYPAENETNASTQITSVLIFDKPPICN